MRWLVVRFSAIGDCVMAVPVASRIRRAEPGAWIAWAVERRCAAVVDVERLVDLRWEAPLDEWQGKGWSPAVWRAQLIYYARLRRERFDFGIDLQGHMKNALCLRIARPRRRLSVPASDVLAARLNPTMTPADGVVHRVEVGLECLRQLAHLEADASPIMPDVRAGVSKLQEQFGIGKPIATIAVGAGHPSKMVPAGHWKEVGAALQREGFHVVWLGGPELSAPELAGTTDWVGRLSLAETMAAIQASAVHLAADTGTGHLAAAYNVPVVSVFGPTDPAVYRPYTQRGVVLREGDDPAAVRPESIVAAAMSMVGRDG